MDESVQDFLKDVPQDYPTDNLNEALPGAPKSQEPEKEIEPRNREERRQRTSKWEERLSQKERDIIEREARLKAIEEIQRQNAPKDVPDEWIQMWGDKPETRAAWALQERINERNREQIRQEMLEEIRGQRAAEAEEARAVEDGKEEAIELVEDNFSVDMSSNTPAARKAKQLYLKALEDVADDDGNADPEIAYELYQARRSRDTDNSKNKDLAARTIAPAGQADSSKLEDDANRAYLRSIGIKV